jgi:hypothetical protein
LLWLKGLECSAFRQFLDSVHVLKKGAKWVKQEANEIFHLFQEMFRDWLKIRPDGLEAMTKAYYKQYAKQLKATGKRF